MRANKNQSYSLKDIMDRYRITANEAAEYLRITVGTIRVKRSKEYCVSDKHRKIEEYLLLNSHIDVLRDMYESAKAALKKHKRELA